MFDYISLLIIAKGITTIGLTTLTIYSCICYFEVEI